MLQENPDDFSNQILVSDFSIPQGSKDVECCKSSTRKSLSSKLFGHNCEKPRPTSEYVDKKYEKPFNKVAPELRMIGGLGDIKCVARHAQRPLVNRPTQVQQLCHTKTKLSPNFALTEQFLPLECARKKKPGLFEATERVKFAENLPTPSTPLEETKTTKDLFDHQNPFTLDLNALTEYQKQKHNAEEMERRRNYQIIRRTMETKALKTEGAERIKDEARKEKFKLPAFFNISEAYGNVEAAQSVHTFADKCKVVTMTDKPKNREILQRHYMHKEEKLRKRLEADAEEEKKLEQEKTKLLEEEREYFVFSLADKSFPTSECDSNSEMQHEESEELDYDLNGSNDSKLERKSNKNSFRAITSDRVLATKLNIANKDDANIPCGEKVGNRIFLRSIHDRICNEPRGKTNYHHLKETRDATCFEKFSHRECLDKMANDPEILSEPPRGKILSSLKVEQEPNDDKLFLFDDPLIQKKSVAIVSPIRQHIEEIDEKIKIRANEAHVKKSESHMSIVNNKNNNRENLKRYQRMKFMGIPVSQTPSNADKKSFESNLKAIVAKISQKSILSHETQTSDFTDKSISRGKHSNTRTLPNVMLVPKVPELDYTEERECSKVDKFVRFRSAQLRGTNAKNLRIDKSLPWIQDELNAIKLKLEKVQGDEESLANANQKVEILEKRKTSGGKSAIKKSFNEIIATKLQAYKALDDISVIRVGVDESVDEIQSTVDSTASLSSTGTYFTNDSGSCLMVQDKIIPKSQMNLQKKFQNPSFVTTMKKPLLEMQPYLVPTIEQLNLVKELNKPKDKFHTYRTRSCANIRDRIQITSTRYEDELIGDEEFTAPPKYSTDIDEYYRSEFYNDYNKPTSDINKLRETFRKNLDICWIKERMILDHLESIKNTAIKIEVDSNTKEYDKFLDEYKQESFRKSSKIKEEEREHFKECLRLRKVDDDLRDGLEPLKMNIFYHALNFVHLMMLGKCQYLFKPIEWRLVNDYIHRTPEGELENIRVSIANIRSSNLWDQNNASIEIIMDFINNVYLKEAKGFKKVFANGEEFLNSLKELQTKSLRPLQQFHEVTKTLSNSEKELYEFEAKNAAFIDSLTHLHSSLSRRKNFIEGRLEELEKQSQTLMYEPLEDSTSSEEIRTLRGLCEVVFKRVVIKKADTSLTKHYTAVEKVAAIEKKALELLKLLDNIPRPDLIMQIEEKVRNERKRKLLIAERACKIEQNVGLRISQLRRCLAKPPKKEKRKGKLTILPKKQTKSKISKPLLTSIEEEYIRAFTELGVSGKIHFDGNVKQMIDRIKNESIPFYLDHLLDKLGFQVSKESDQKAEQIIIDETENFKYKDVLDDVRNQVKMWEDFEEQVKKENIRKTPYLYK